MADIGTFITIVGPLATASVTLILWGVLVAIQTPRPYWRDALTRSIAGLLISVGVLLILLMLERAGVPGVKALDARLTIILAGLFALAGLPRTIHELRTAIHRETTRR